MKPVMTEHLSSVCTACILHDKSTCWYCFFRNTEKRFNTNDFSNKPIHRNLLVVVSNDTIYLFDPKNDKDIHEIKIKYYGCKFANYNGCTKVEW